MHAIGASARWLRKDNAFECKALFFFARIVIGDKILPTQTIDWIKCFKWFKYA
jgi:hypothetical protein